MLLALLHLGTKGIRFYFKCCGEGGGSRTRRFPCRYLILLGVKLPLINN
ncbi:MAG: hypothetical protein KJP23_08390 [Deltaproteobacteria bacterium]|nr:hypothetical protein [Deltaproteobacteria bacterium]